MIKRPVNSTVRAKKNQKGRKTGLATAQATGKTDRVTGWLIPALLCLLTGIAFLPALRNGFVNWDDEMTLVDNLGYRGLGWPQIKWMFTTFYMGHYQPLSWLSFSLNYLFSGLDPMPIHLTNICLHCANTVLLYFVSIRLFSLALPQALAANKRSVTIASAFAALFFAVHPLRVESVAWATERRELLATFFLFCALLAYLKAAMTAGGQAQTRWRITALSMYGLSLLSEAAGITFPLVLLVLDAYPLKRLVIGRRERFAVEPRAVILEKVPYVLLAAVIGLVALFAQADAKALKAVGQYGFAARVAQAFYGLTFYIWKTILPFSLSPLYELPPDLNPFAGGFLVSGFVVIGLSLFFLRTRQWWPAGIATWLAYIAILFPVLGFAQSGPQLVADRYSYLSCIGWAELGGAFLCCVWCLGGATKNGGRAIALGTIGILVLLGARTWKLTEVWHDSETFWRYSVAASPDSATAHYNLGLVFAHQGNFDEASAQYFRAIEIAPKSADAHLNLGQLLAHSGEFQKAIQQYWQVLMINPSSAKAYNNLGAVFAQEGDLDRAIDYYEYALKLDPRYEPALANFGAANAQRGNTIEAIKDYEMAVQINPMDTTAQEDLADTLMRVSDLSGAENHLEKALERQPSQSELHERLGSVFAVEGNVTAAAEQFRQATILNPNDAAAYLNLGRVTAALGDLNQAIYYFEKAIEIQPKFADAHKLLAQALTETGKLAEAATHEREARLLQTSNPPTLIQSKTVQEPPHT